MLDRDYDIRDRDYDIRDHGAIEQSDGSYVDRDGCITWYNKQGEWHREDGPAVIYNDGEVEWFINGASYNTFDNWLIKLNKSDEAKMLLRLRYA